MTNALRFLTWRSGFTSLLLLMLLALPAQAKMVNGVVVYVDSKLIVVATKAGCTVGELYGGYYSLRENDLVVGELESYGFKDVYCPATGKEARIWIDNFWLSTDRAVEWLRGKK